MCISASAADARRGHWIPWCYIPHSGEPLNVGAGNWTLKSRICSEPVGHLSCRKKKCTFEGLRGFPCFKILANLSNFSVRKFYLHPRFLHFHSMSSPSHYIHWEAKASIDSVPAQGSKSLVFPLITKRTGMCCHRIFYSSFWNSLETFMPSPQLSFHDNTDATADVDFLASSLFTLCMGAF